MDVFKAVILGVVQGFAEFLPISSSGHLVLLQKIFGLEENMMAFDIVLHLGSLTAVFVAFWAEIAEILRRPLQKMTALLIVATVPAVIAALCFQHQIEALFAGSLFLAISFIITGLLLFYSDSFHSGQKQDEDIGWMDAICIGCLQAIAIPPGISRSGCTITGALARGLDRRAAARFSFLLSIPAILGAAVFTFKDVLTGSGLSGVMSSMGALPLLFGFTAAALSGYLSIRFMLTLIQKAKLRVFAYYVFALAFLILLDRFALGLFF
ncbi:MAG: undecaprenyl-diphosphate phosphatase [Clostridiales bacterium]|nr:undecaprenyl-diphosphate phosphatase [Clostridiales bacterium]